MAQMIRPVSDLRNNFADISKTVHETKKPVFLTKNGFGDMVVLSMEAYENLQFESEVYFKLLEAEQAEENGCKRYTLKEARKRTKEATAAPPRVFRKTRFCSFRKESLSAHSCCRTPIAPARFREFPFASLFFLLFGNREIKKETGYTCFL